MTAGITQRQRDAAARQLAHGRAKVLAIGIDHYDSSCGFDPLKTCRNDALGFANCFRDIPQLNADSDGVRALVSGKGVVASRGEIIKALRELVRSTTEDDRLIFYFSGHGQRLPNDPESYLVPQDAYTDDDPSCLVPMAMVKEILNSSPAKQKLMFLDACLTGSSTAHLKAPRAPISRKAFDEYLRNTRGVVILASSAEDVSSSTRSPNPQHSLFTAYLLPALRGEQPGALDEKLLTIPKLHDYLSLEVSRWAKSAQMVQRPILNESTSGTIVLADFSGPLLSPDALGIDGQVFSHFDLSNSKSTPIKTILTELKGRHYSQAYLEKRANDALGEQFEEELGSVVSRLRRQFKWASADMAVEGAGIIFPDGHYSIHYQATQQLHGELVKEVSLQPAWQDTPGLVATLLECLELRPTSIRFALRKPNVPVRCIPQLEASGWQIESELPHKVEAALENWSLVLEKHALTLVGLPVVELFTVTPDKTIIRKTTAVLAILGGS